jgi:hypothetical protein
VPRLSACAILMAGDPNKCLVQTRAVCPYIWKSRQGTRREADYAGTNTAGKKQKNPLSGDVCLLTTGDLPRNGSAGVTVRLEPRQLY